MAVAKSRKKKSAHVTSDGFSYLTKRFLISKAKRAAQTAAHDAMNLMGYVVTVKNGWVVKEFADGHSEQLQKI